MTDKPAGITRIGNLPSLMTFDELVAYVRKHRPVVVTRLRCHPSVVVALRDSAPEPEWPPRMYHPELGSIEVIATTDLPHGGWELLRDDEVIDSGSL